MKPNSLLLVLKQEFYLEYLFDLYINLFIEDLIALSSFEISPRITNKAV